MRYDPYKDERQTSFNFPVTRMVIPTPEAKAAIEATFAEEYEPQYVKDRRAAEQEALDQGTTISERKAWARAAAISRQRIAEKFHGRATN